ncbi:MAG: J domain-containing protein, partial [Synergistes sp.]|nr:J domain-containing protein [Synergistes sp.]
MAAPGKKDYYEILGVSRGATPDEIKKAYRKLTQLYHPDKHKGESEAKAKAAEEKYKEINEAYGVLSDEKKRQQYDQFGYVGDMPPGGGGFGGFGGANGQTFTQEDLGDIFGDLFGGGGGFGGGRSRRANPNAPRKGADLEATVKVTLEEAYRGLSRKIEIPRLVTCKHCDGTGAEPGSKVET